MPVVQLFQWSMLFSVPQGVFPTLRHNKRRDLTASLLTEVCHEVSTDPGLQLLTGETFCGASTNTQDGARLDVTRRGFWWGTNMRELSVM